MRGIGVNVQVEEDAIQELINDILAVSQGIDDLNPVLTQLAITFQNQMLTGRFNDRSGELRHSIRAFIQDNTLKIRMLYYGYFLSFGTRADARLKLTDEVASVFNKPQGSFFNQPDNNKGIARRNFYPTNIEEVIAQKLEAIVLDELD